MSLCSIGMPKSGLLLPSRLALSALAAASKARSSFRVITALSEGLRSVMRFIDSRVSSTLEIAPEASLLRMPSIVW